MAAVVNTVQVTASDRLGFSLFFATILHAMVILGIGFGIHFSTNPNRSTMLEVTLVLTKTHQEPVKAETIASENQLASGNSDITNQPSSPVVGTSLLDTQGIAPIHMDPSSAASSESTSQQELVLAQEATEFMQKFDQIQENTDQPQQQQQDLLNTQQLELAKLVAEVNQEQQDYAKRPRINYIDTLSAKTATEANYVREWVDKVERVGNLNYPDEVKYNSLTGTLILSVLLNHDGKVVKMEIKTSAGKSILDEAAKKIVRIAAPFKPFPEEMSDSYEQLMVTRTWLFGQDNTLLTK